MMLMDQLAGSGKDEYYTPAYAVKPIIKHLKKKGFNLIWCPFDTSKSHFVIELTKAGFNVISGHIGEGKNFFEYMPSHFDAIVSNPPYSLKNEVLERLYEIGKPFAMLMGVVGIFESQRRFNLFKENGCEVLYFNKRISFFENFEDQKPSKNPPFSTVYICSNVLSDKMIFEVIEK